MDVGVDDRLRSRAFPGSLGLGEQFRHEGHLQNRTCHVAAGAIRLTTTPTVMRYDDTLVYHFAERQGRVSGERRQPLRAPYDVDVIAEPGLQRREPIVDVRLEPAGVDAIRQGHFGSLIGERDFGLG